MNQHILEKYNVPVPRYTSYPPANFFGTISRKGICCRQLKNRILNGRIISRFTFTSPIASECVIIADAIPILAPAKPTKKLM